MLREFSTSLLRVAAKQGLQYAASKQNEWLGFAVGLANAMTEKADTRNWQTLPYSVSYVRIPLQSSENQVSANFFTSDNVHRETFIFPANPKKRAFCLFDFIIHGLI